uniref:Uncharacterized protein n=1 Tax=Anguilla anguilla TaxID=7936 RepID=A0A0E9S6I9_ANGAN
MVLLRTTSLKVQKLKCFMMCCFNYFFCTHKQPRTIYDS